VKVESAASMALFASQMSSSQGARWCGLPFGLLDASPDALRPWLGGGLVLDGRPARRHRGGGAFGTKASLLDWGTLRSDNMILLQFFFLT
jgi:hypothetical protein